MTDGNARRAFALAFILAVAMPAAAQQVLYKLTDRQGRVTYSDSVPKNYDGTVQRIVPDTTSNLLPSGRPPEAQKAPAAATGMAEDRRQKRDELEKILGSKQRLKKLIRAEMLEIKTTYADRRMTKVSARSPTKWP